MIKNKLALLTCAVSVALLNLTPAFANNAACKNPNAVHCNPVTGLSADKNDGRYFKVYLSNFDFSITSCLTAADEDFFIDGEDAEYFQGTNKMDFYICTDGSGSTCEPIGTDTFTVSKNGNTYVSDPSSYTIDFTKFAPRYPQCKSKSPKGASLKASFKTKR